MKAVDANLLELLQVNQRFVVPIYQRVYSWGRQECVQLWDDIVWAGRRENLTNHFTGSIVYIERGSGTIMAKEPHLIIDGQQRVTTVTLLLAALASHLEKLPEADQEPVAGFSPRKIRGYYLVNQMETGESHFKLTLTQHDKEALRAVVQGSPAPGGASRVIDNHRFFADRLGGDDVDIVAVCRGLEKLRVVDVKLTRGSDDPQLVFESMNATGKRLSQADLIRNFVLMDLEPTRQHRLYEDYWFPMERRFHGQHEGRFDEFVRNFLTLRDPSHEIPRIDQIYDAFKDFAYEQEAIGLDREGLVLELSNYAEWFAALALGLEPNPTLRALFAEIDGLATVAYPFLLQVYGDYADGRISRGDVGEIAQLILSYLFRRAVCRIPTNSLNKTFATLPSAIDPNRYVESVSARMLTLPDYRRFPTDDEFLKALVATDIYNLRRRNYLLRKLENRGRKEEVPVADYTVEHVMPQHLTETWKASLGPEWQTIHDKYLHTLGNLTLTAYNPEFSNRPFLEKRDMEGGFSQSPLRLNRELGRQQGWGGEEIESRASTLATEAVTLWPRPTMDDGLLARYRAQFNDSRRFDWSLTHSILRALPPGHWTGYYSLAEAVGTGPQAIANHVAKCAECVGAHRVLTWNGAVSDDFHWGDPDDARDPIAVLQEEGIRIIDGKADPDQQLDANELLALVD